MALIDKASLLMVPSTYEAGKLYNVLPSGNRAPDSTDQNSGYDQTRADFDFDRGSNAAASRINSFGLIEKYRENLLVQSNQFDTTWGKVNISTTNGQEGYDGTNNAWKIEGTGSAAFSYLLQSESNNIVKTRSVYAKAGSVSYLGIWGSGSNFGYFDLSNGTLDNISGSSAITHSITDVGNGWYRCEFTTTGSTSSFYIVASANANGTSLSTGDYIYIQSAQLESGLVATEVLTSGATTGKAGVLVDLPRINYDANGENGSLLLEPSRQQLFNYSEYFGDWGVSAGTLTANSATSPEGVKNAYLFTEDTTTGYHRFAKNSGGSNSTKTFSVFAKWAGGSGRKWLTMDNGPICYFDLENGVKGNVGANCTADIEDYGNGWYRCYFTHTNSITGTLYIGSSNTNGGAGNHLGNGENAFYLYGAQAEDGATYASSYIPNHSGTGGVTRAADSCSVTGASDVIGQTEGTLYAEFEIGEDNAHFFLYTNTSNAIYIQTRIGDMWRAYVINGGVYQVTITTGSVPTSGFVKMAFAYKENDFALYANGSLIGSDTSGSVPACDSYDLGLGPYGAGFSAKQTKQTALFNERLSNAELATLTTL